MSTSDTPSNKPRPAAHSATTTTGLTNTSLPGIPGGWAATPVTIDEQQFQIQLPASPDAFLDDPAVQQANRETDYMPYWAYLWPAAKQMANLVLNEPWPQDSPTLELGSGVGLVGIAALAAGLRVTFSDYDKTSLVAATHNALANQLQADAAELLDWRELDAAPLRSRFQVILGCDVLYEVPLHAPLLNVLDRFLEDDGVCWFGDPGRAAAAQFCDLASSRGYTVELRNSDGVRPRTGERIPPAFQLVVLHRHKSQQSQAMK
jgi:predicted nicotinamide N-methyase